MRPNLPALALLAACAAAAGPLALAPQPARAANGDTMTFTLDSVAFDGNQRVSTDTLTSVAGLAAGQKINRDGVVQAFQNVQDEYRKENVGGSIQPVMTTHGSHMKLVFKIAELAPDAGVKVAPTLDHETFTGNVKVSSDQLASAMTIKPGSPVTTELLHADLDAVSAIYKGAKVGASISAKVTKTSDTHVDVNFEITENPPPKK